MISELLDKQASKITLAICVLSLVIFYGIRDHQKSTQNRRSQLQGEIILWAEMPIRLTKEQSKSHQSSVGKVVEKFQGLNPGVRILTKFLPSNQIFKPFELQAKRGGGPDLLIAYESSQIVRLIQAGLLKSVDESQIEKSQFHANALRSVRYRGKLYGFPLYFSTQTLCYNLDKVKTPPKTLTELIQQARTGHSVGVLSGFTEAFWGTGIFGDRLLDSSGRIILDRGQGWAQWMKWLKEAQHEPNFILSNNAEALKRAFVEEKLAYLTCSSGWIAYFTEVMGKNKLGVALLPGDQGKAATPMLWVGSILLNQVSSPKQSKIALQFAQFLTNTEQQKQLQSELPFISSNKNVMIDRRLFPVQAVLLDQFQTTINHSLDDEEKFQIIRDHGDMLYQKVLTGELNPDQAASDLVQQINQQ